MTKRFFCFFIPLILSITIYGGVRDFDKKSYGENQDFTGIFIYSIIQDQDGFLWIGADDGVYRFDGKQMLNLNKQDSAINDLVTAQTTSSDGNLYIGYYHGGISKVIHNQYYKILSQEDFNDKVVKLDTFDNRIIAITVHGKIIIVENDEYQILTHPELTGKIINDFSYYDSSMRIATNEGLLSLDLDDTSLLHPEWIEELAFVNTTSLFYDETHSKWWIGTEEGLFFTTNWTEIHPCEEFPREAVSAINADQRGNLWIGTRNHGLYELIFAQDDVRITHFSKSNGFESDQISQLYIDSEDEIWVGTFGKGLVQLNRKDFHHYDLREIYRDGKTQDLLHWHGNAYLATSNGLIEGKFMPGLDSLYFELMPNTSDLNISSLGTWQDKLLIATKKGAILTFHPSEGILPIFLRDENGDSQKNAIRHFANGVDGVLNVSFSEKGVYQYDREGNYLNHWNTTNYFFHNEIFCTVTDQNGNLWFSSHGSGLAVSEAATGEIRYLSRDGDFPSMDINTITSTKDGAIWIGTAGDGVFRYKNNEFKRYDKRIGLLSDHGNSLSEDQGGNIWVGHRKGLSLIQVKEQLIRVFNHPIELGETESTLNAMSIDNQGNVYTGNPYGFTKIILPHIHHINRVRSTHITDVRFFYKRDDLRKYTDKDTIDNILPQNMIFTHMQNHITFDYVAINLKNPDAIFYQYKLEGYDKTWAPITSSNQVTYTNLDPGKYIFRIKESDHQDYWKSGNASISFRIDKPFWDKWWFYALEISFIISVMLFAFKLLGHIENKFLGRLIIYTSVFIMFEFIYTALEPYLDQLSGNIPIIKVIINLCLALLLFPIESLVTYLFKKKAISKIQADSGHKISNIVFSNDRRIVVFSKPVVNGKTNQKQLWFAVRDFEQRRWSNSNQLHVPHSEKDLKATSIKRTDAGYLINLESKGKNFIHKITKKKKPPTRINASQNKIGAFKLAIN